MAPPQIDTHAVKVFDMAVELTAQQMVSALASTVRRESLEGEQKLFNDYGSASMVERTARGQQSVPQELARGRRAIVPRFWEYVEPFDLQMDPQRLEKDIRSDSDFFRAIMASVERQQDDVIIEAFDATAYGGKSGTTAVVFDTNQDVAQISSGPLVVTQIRNAARLLFAANVFGPKTAAIHSDGFDQLLATTHFASADYNRVQALVDGSISGPFAGIDRYVRANQIAQEGANSKYAFVYSMEAMIFGMKPVVTRWSELGDRGLSWSYGAFATMAATRRFENQIVRIDYDHSEVPAQA